MFLRKRVIPPVISTEYETASGCFSMIAGFYGKYISTEEAFILCDVSKEGCSFEDLEEAFKTSGFSVERLSMDELVSGRRDCLPVILRTDRLHYYVLESIHGGVCHICDPLHGYSKKTLREITEDCEPVVLCAVPSDSFHPEGSPYRLPDSFRLIARPVQKRLAVYILLLVIGSILIIGSGLYSKRSIDLWMSKAFSDRIIFAFWGYAFLCICAVAVQLICAFLYSRLAVEIYAGEDDRMIRTILNLPQVFYRIHPIAEFMHRMNSSQSSSALLAVESCNIISQGIIILAGLGAIALFSPGIFIAVVCLTLLSYLVLYYVMRLEAACFPAFLSGLIQNMHYLYNGFDAMDSIHNFGAETAFLKGYVGRMMNISTYDTKYKYIERGLGGLPAMLSSYSHAAILIIGILGVVRGSSSFGAMVAAETIYTLIQSPINYITSISTQLSSLRADMEKVWNIRKTARPLVPDNIDEIFPDELTDSECKLNGQISLRNVCFGYRLHGKPQLTDINMEIKPGELVALVGTSGSGKTTIKELIAGRLQPWSGEILYDGRKKEDILPVVWSNSLASVDQSIRLLDDSVMNNIRMLDDTIEDFTAILAAKNAEIYDVILGKEQGFNTRVYRDGYNFSGGEKQRLEIARVIAREPTIVLLDEATSALDTVVEEKLFLNFRKMGVTVIMAAHRLSSIRLCDRIYVILNGRIIAEGTHEELCRACEHYRELVIKE